MSTMTNPTGDKFKKRGKRGNRFKKTVNSIDVVKIAKGLIKKNEEATVELKYHDVTIQNETMSNVGQLRELTGTILQNVGYNNRIGDEISLHSMQFRGSVNASFGVGADNYNNCRIIVFRWMEGYNPDPLTFLQSNNNPQSSIDVDYLPSTQILYDNLVGTSATQGLPITVFKEYRKLRGKSLWQTDDSSDIGQIYLFTIGSSTVGPHPLLNMYFRFRFMDA